MRAVHMEEDAIRLCNAGDAAMIHTKMECSKSCVASLNALTRRFDETEELKRRLQAQMQETDETIIQTELSLTKTKKELDSHEAPLRTLDKQFAMRDKLSP